MSSDVLQFQCSACQSVLTVPSHMAGVTGPCPICGQIITSPSATPTPVAPVSLFASPAPSPSYNQAPAKTSVPTGGPVMPMPNSIAQHLSPIGNPSQPPGGGFLGSPPPPAPEKSAPWQQPGLGQTLLGGMPPPHLPSASPGNVGPSLPPRRAEGQQPLAAAPQQPPIAPWGGAPQQPAGPPQTPTASALFPQRSNAGAPSHSSLIPGSPTLPLLGAQGGAEAAPSSLLSREISSSPPAALPVAINSPEKHQELPKTTPRHSRPLKKPSRSSNIFMFALAVLFLAGFLAAAGWMFREPIMELVNRYMPSKEDIIANIPKIPQTNPVQDSPVVEAPAPPITSSPTIAEAPAKPAFDPEEPMPPRAGTPTPEELAALQPSTKVTPKIETPSQGLMEVPSKTMTPALQNDSAPADPKSLALPGSNEVKIEVSEEAKPAAEALMKFLTATNLKERLRYTLAADSMKPLMELYYQAQPSGPIRVDAVGLVRLDPKPQLGGGAHAVFGVESRTWEYPVPVMLEEGKAGFQVDWLSFVEFKDRLLEKFFEGYQEGPARFHVGITRTHYFEDKVPNSDNKDAFRIGPAPPNPYLTTVFVEKDSQVGRDLRDRIPWGSQVWAIVELEWVKLGTQQWVQLVGVPQLNWYSVPATEKKAKPGKSTDLPNEIQRAVPVGR